MLLNVFNS